MAFCHQVGLLMWKNWLIQRRRLCVSIFELLLPALFSILLVLLRKLVVAKKVPQITYFRNESIVPNEGFFPQNGIIGYAPESKATEEVMSNVLLLLTKYMPPNKNMSKRGFASEEDSLKFYQINSTFMRHIIVFHGVSMDSQLMPRRVSFTIRPHSSDRRWHTDLVYPVYLTSGPSERSAGYHESAVLYLQSLVGESLARYWLAREGGNPDSIGFEIYTKPFAYPPYYKDNLATVLGTSLPLFLVLSFILSVIIGTKNVVVEKEKKLKESMKLMGLTSAAYWVSWYLTLCVYVLPAMVVYTLMFKLSLSDGGPVLNNTDGSLFLVILLCYAHAMITFCFMVSTFVQKGNFGAVLSGILYFAFFIPFNYIVSNFESTSRRLKFTACLLFNTAIGLATNELGIYEMTGEGANWGNFYKSHSETISVTILECMIMMIISSCIHILITWYLDNVRPGEFGVPKPWNFCVMKSYWFGSEGIREGSFRVDIPQSKYFEKDPTGRPAGIRLCNLRKEFGRRVAVAGTSMNMYEGQITVLLGHNGAGKTTTMSMITGFIPPTLGTAIVNGFDIRTDMDNVRSSLGLCPQHDILFDTITVTEHFHFFAKMKGYSSPNLKEEIIELAKKVGLQNKLDTYSKNLSGGQKRKLSVGIALIGQSKVVILDEPSSGMDPAARRQTWNILQEAREGRTILLTTHYMDEADVLGDRIAIMAGGVIKCCGTSLFLKKQYGTGYHLVVVKTPKCDVGKLTQFIQSIIPKATLETVISTEVSFLLPEKESKKFANLFRSLDTEKESLNISSFGTTATTMEEVFLKVGEPTHECDFVTRTSSRSATSKEGTRDSLSAGIMYLKITKKPESDVAQITEVVQRFFPSSAPMNVSREKVTYPIQSHQSANLAALSNELENTKEDLKITTFTTALVAIIEDEDEGNAVYDSDNINITNNAADDSGNINVNAESSIVSAFDFNSGFTKHSGFPLEVSRMRGIFVKKALLTLRKRVLTLMQLVLPGLSAFLAMSSASSDSGTGKEPPLTLNILPFGRTRILYTDGNTNYSNYSYALADMYKKQFCSCHDMEYVNLEDGVTFDNLTVRRSQEMGTATHNKKMIVGMEVVDGASPGKFAAIAYFNTKPYHSEPISVNYLVNTFLQFALNTSFSLKSAVHPLIAPVDEQDGSWRSNAGVGASVGLEVAFAMSFVAAVFIAFPIKERQNGAKHMQIMTGISPFTYWFPTFLWDFMIFFVPSLAILLMFVIYDIKSYTEDGRWALVILVLVAYGWAMLPTVYLMQFCFKSPPSGIVMVVITFFISGEVVTLIVDILLTPGFPTRETATTVDTLLAFLFPNYDLAMSLKNIDVNYETLKMCMLMQDLCQFTTTPCCKDTCGTFCLNFESEYTSWTRPGIGKHLTGMVVQGLLFFLVLILIEYNVIQLLWYSVSAASVDTHFEDNITEDSDVAAERKRINSTPISVLTSTDSLVLFNLYKKYGKYVAVDHVCVGIPDRECFGLLGQNGAGKTTTFKMLTGDIIITGGNAYLKGFDIKNNIKQVQANMGYCPQFDPLISQLTARETLTMYGRMRGIPEDSIKRVVESLGEFILLGEYMDEYCGNYSGGNKRKLSTAIALIGDPPFIMLDEPSSGMDPEARRNLWTILSKIRASGRTLILTSHSMEECDALCTRIAIMVNGRYKCLGSPQHLKSKFGQGYTLITKLGTREDGSYVHSGPVVLALTAKFPSTVVFDDHEGYIHFQVPDTTVKLADVFSLMEELKQQSQLEDYSVHQTTLEQIFISFTKTQVVAPEDAGTESKGFFAKLCCK